jgi:hypothetical protein
LCHWRTVARHWDDGLYGCTTRERPSLIEIYQS